MRSARTPSLARVPPGLPGTDRPRAVPAGGRLWLILADVPAARYGPGPLEASLRDLDWVAAVAVAHEAVVEHFARQRGAAVVPMKLFTLFSTAERAAADVAGRRRRIDAILERIAGCEEWGVRVTRGRTPAPAPVADVRSGTAFLAARKERRDATRVAALEAARAAATAFETLAPIARDARRRDGAPAGAVPPLLDAAFLVPSGRRARFRSEARRAARACADAGADLTVTGPWPAYNFVHGAGERT